MRWKELVSDFYMLIYSTVNLKNSFCCCCCCCCQKLIRSTLWNIANDMLWMTQNVPITMLNQSCSCRSSQIISKFKPYSMSNKFSLGDFLPSPPINCFFLGLQNLVCPDGKHKCIGQSFIDRQIYPSSCFYYIQAQHSLLLLIMHDMSIGIVNADKTSITSRQKQMENDDDKITKIMCMKNMAKCYNTPALHAPCIHAHRTSNEIYTNCVRIL